ADRNGRIEVSEFARFCRQIPTLAWKAERARRGDDIGRAAWEMSFEVARAVSVTAETTAVTTATAAFTSVASTASEAGRTGGASDPTVGANSGNDGVERPCTTSGAVVSLSAVGIGPVGDIVK
ncbi:unnamed protein product, partial [Phaeothamnion confervicola]